MKEFGTRKGLGIKLAVALARHGVKGGRFSRTLVFALNGAIGTPLGKAEGCVVILV